MDKQAAEVLGEPVMDGVILLPRGAAKKYRKTVAPAAIGGLAGAAAGALTSPRQVDMNRR